jgi:uncharacterized repeat protein (TIGR03803 family)
MRTIVPTLLLSLLTFNGSFAASTYTFTELHRFLGGAASGNPENQLAQDAAGNLYGTTSYGGNMEECGGQGCGVIFRLSPNGSPHWVYSELYQFHGSTQPYPLPSNLILDAAGNLYGALAYAGSYGAGLIFELSPTPTGPWAFTVLYTFTGGTDGSGPESVVFDGSGHLYGTTGLGGQSDRGTVFELSPRGDATWSEAVIWNFSLSSNLGSNPQSGVVFDAAGNLYGTTAAPGNGIVYKLTRENGEWVGAPIYTFSGGADGSLPNGPPTLDAAGNVYGTTQDEGVFDGGTVYQLSLNADGSYTFHLVFSFKGEGIYTAFPVVIDNLGNLFGALPALPLGGQIFELSPSGAGTWNHSVVYTFYSGLREPQALLLGSTGNLFGVAFASSSGCLDDAGCGGVFELSPSGD